MSTWAAALPPPPPLRHHRHNAAAAATADSAHCCSWWVPSLCTAPQCRRIAENLRSFCRGSCVHYTNTTGIFRYVPCLGCLVHLVLTAYLKQRPFTLLLDRKIVRHNKLILSTVNLLIFGIFIYLPCLGCLVPRILAVNRRIAVEHFTFQNWDVICLKNLHIFWHLQHSICLHFGYGEGWYLVCEQNVWADIF